jgi:hypothetical protein
LVSHEEGKVQSLKSKVQSNARERESLQPDVGKAPEDWRTPRRFARFGRHRRTRQRLGLRGQGGCRDPALGWRGAPGKMCVPKSAVAAPALPAHSITLCAFRTPAVRAPASWTAAALRRFSPERPAGRSIVPTRRLRLAGGWWNGLFAGRKMSAMTEYISAEWPNPGFICG